MRPIKQTLFFLLFISLTSIGQTAKETAIYSKLEEELKGKEDSSIVHIHRIKDVDKTIELETFISMEGDYKVATEILNNLDRYNTWVIPGINERPSGGKYYVQILSLRKDPPSDLIVELRLNVPIFNSSFDRRFRMATKQDRFVYTLEGIADPSETSVVISASGQMKLFPAKGDSSRLWVHTKGRVHFRPWLLFELLPIPMMERETKSRIQTILQNYQKEEGRIVELRG